MPSWMLRSHSPAWRGWGLGLAAEGEGWCDELSSRKPVSSYLVQEAPCLLLRRSCAPLEHLFEVDRG